MSRLEFGGLLDAHLLRGEPGGAGGDGLNCDGDEDAGHVACESCRIEMCTGAREVCEGGCVFDDEAVAFAYQGHPYCQPCADEARAAIAEDIARDAAHARGDVCAVVGCLICNVVSMAEGAV